MLWEKDPNEYVLKYLVDNRPPRTPQELPASAGSAFDAVTKAKLYEALFGKGHNPKFEFDALFESQVEPHNRDVARDIGFHIFENYEHTGAYDDLLGLMQGAQRAPEFEFDAAATVDGVPLFGKPDCRFVNHNGIHIILDWKVKGYCSKYGASPVKGHSLQRDGIGWVERNLTKAQLKKIAASIEEGVNEHGIVGKHSRTHNQPHKLYLPMNFRGLEINTGFLETCNAEWATQLAMYGWMMGERVGDENVVVCIDEVVCKYMGEGQKPLIRIANHKSRVSRDFQINLHARMKNLWDSIHEGWIFKDMSKQESAEVFQMLQLRATGMASDGSEEEDWYSQLGRPAFR